MSHEIILVEKRRKLLKSKIISLLRKTGRLWRILSPKLIYYYELFFEKLKIPESLLKSLRLKDCVL